MLIEWILTRASHHRPHLPGIAMEHLKLCRRYLAAINASSLADILALFDSPNTPVLSPTHGQMPVSAYIPTLFRNNERFIIRIRHVFEALSQGASIALHCHYTCIGNDGQVVEFDSVDIFELNEARKKFKKLTVIYDPTNLSVRTRREELNNPDFSSRPAIPDETRYYNFELDFDSPRQAA